MKRSQLKLLIAQSESALPSEQGHDPQFLVKADIENFHQGDLADLDVHGEFSGASGSVDDSASVIAQPDRVLLNMKAFVNS